MTDLQRNKAMQMTPNAMQSSTQFNDFHVTDYSNATRLKH